VEVVHARSEMMVGGAEGGCIWKSRDGHDCRWVLF